jgi:hypothetical protein
VTGNYKFRSHPRDDPGTPVRMDTKDETSSISFFLAVAQSSTITCRNSSLYRTESRTHLAFCSLKLQALTCPETQRRETRFKVSVVPDVCCSITKTVTGNYTSTSRHQDDRGTQLWMDTQDRLKITFSMPSFLAVELSSIIVGPNSRLN